MRGGTITILLALGLILSAVFAVDSGVLHPYFQHLASGKWKAQVHLGATVLVPHWPLRITLGPTEIERSDFKLRWKKLTFDWTPGFNLDQVKLHVENPVLEVGSELPMPPKSFFALGSRPFGLQFAVTDGQLRLGSSIAEKFDFTFEQNVFMSSVARLEARALVRDKSISAALPVELRGESIVFTHEIFDAGDMTLRVSEVETQVRGMSFLEKGIHHWSVILARTDLSVQDHTPFDFVGDHWQGKIEGHWRVQKDGPNLPWASDAEIHLENVVGRAKIDAQGWKVEGPVALMGHLQADLSQGVWKFSNLETHIDLSEAHVSYLKLLDSQVGSPILLHVQASGSPLSLRFNALDLQVSPVRMHTSGVLSLIAPYDSQLTLDIPKFKIKGLEPVLPILRQVLNLGEAHFHGSIQGPLSEWRKCSFQIADFAVNNLVAEFHLTDMEWIDLLGRFQMMFSAQGEWTAGRFHGVHLKSQMDAGQAGLVLGPLRKEAGQKLKLDAEVVSRDDSLYMRQLDIDSFLVHSKMAGQIDGTHAGMVRLKDLNWKITGLDLAGLRIALPPYHDQIPKGQLNADLKFNGAIVGAEAWTNWPIATTGSVRAHFTEFKDGVSSLGVVRVVAKPSTEAPSAGWLPKGDLTTKLNVEIRSDLEDYNRNKLNFSGASVQGQLVGTRFQGRAHIREIFGGNLDLREIELRELDGQPKLSAQMDVREVDAAETIAYFLESAPNLLNGKLSGECTLACDLETDTVGFWSGLKAKGQFSSESMTFPSLLVGGMLHEMMAKLRGSAHAGKNAWEGKAFMASVQGNFELHGQALRLENLHAQAASSDELSLDGKVVLPTLDGDLAGDFFWAEPSIRACLLRDNSDAEGRMIIPVAIRGDLMHPGFSVLSDTLNKWAVRETQCR